MCEHFADGSGKLGAEDNLKKPRRVIDGKLSLTHKGAVRIDKFKTENEDDPVAPIVVNASLYTVLVTDQPIEKLRLKR